MQLCFMVELYHSVHIKIILNVIWLKNDFRICRHPFKISHSLTKKSL